jgi:Methyltransferase FkbM domain
MQQCEEVGMNFALRNVLPDRVQPIRILRGPFRGAIIAMNPRNSLRKLVGLYEYELNGWLKTVLPRVTRVLDVGANDGYFTFGCAAAFCRLQKTGEIVAFEPQQQHIDELQESLGQQAGTTPIRLVQAIVGDAEKPGVTTLDSVKWERGNECARSHTLIKIDVEGAELEVLRGAQSWMNPSNYFVIEVHEEPYLEQISRLFAEHELRLNRIDQRPLPLLGREMRSKENWWLVSHLGCDGRVC